MSTSTHKRKLVPAALHSELTEYSSLLRALRTNDTLDVTSQLTKYYVQKGKEKAVIYDEIDEDEGEEDEEEGLENDVGHDEDEYQPKAGPSSSKRQQSVSSPSEKKNGKRKPNPPRETWTRWPLLAEDVPIPEWSLEDEIAHITTSLIQKSFPSTSESESNSDSDPDADAPSPALISSLTLSSSTYLDSILASIASIVPKRPPSMLNRLAPAGWQTVLAAAQLQAVTAQTGGSISTKVLERVQKRLENLYGNESLDATVSTNDGVAVALTPARMIVASPSRKAVTTAVEVVESVASSSNLLPRLPEGPPTSALCSTALPLSSSVIPPSSVYNPDLASHRMHTLHASSNKLSEAFASYRASPSDLLSLDFGFPGMEFSLPDKWAETWYASRLGMTKKAEQEKEKEERRKLRAKRRKRKAEIKAKKEADEEAGTGIGTGKPLGRKRGPPFKVKVGVKPASDGSEDDYGDDAGNGGQGVGEEDRVASPGKRKRSGSVLDDDDEANGPIKKKKRVLRNGKSYKSSKFVDSESE